MLKGQLIPKFAWAFLVTMALSACGDWPPHGQDLKAYIVERKPQIEELISEFENSGFGRIDCRPCFANKPRSEWGSVSYRLVDGVWRRSENPRNLEFAEMFSRAGVLSVFKRSSDEVEVGLALPSRHKNKRYVVQLLHDRNHAESKIKECVAGFENIDCGWCKVSIDDDFWVRYQWYLDDPDPDTSRARDDGKMSWDEWEKKDDAARDACLRNGLREQGYVFGDS